MILVRGGMEQGKMGKGRQKQTRVDKGRLFRRGGKMSGSASVVFRARRVRVRMSLVNKSITKAVYNI
jgi:hypothetical protein